MELTYSIGSVERETGLSKDILRVWERRYGFPNPVRDAAGERSYSASQVEKLRLLKRLLDQGHRPGKVIGYELTELRALSEGPAARAMRDNAGSEERRDLLDYIALCKSYRFDELRRQLTQVLLRIGLHRFVVDVIAPLNTMIGTRWAEGSFAIYEANLYTESLQIVMRNAIAAIPPSQQPGLARPRILLTTFPYEQDVLELLMAEAIFALEGARCISLGVQTPITDIGLAARSQRADIVALSFSDVLNANKIAEGLSDLQRQLPDLVQIWASGESTALRRRQLPHARILRLADIGSALAEWRSEREFRAA